jgi:transposase
VADTNLLPQGLEISEEDLAKTPPTVLTLLLRSFEYASQLEQRIKELEAKISELTAKLDQNSSNSNKPPSTDNPYKEKTEKHKGEGRKRGGRKGHKGHRQQFMAPTETKEVKPGPCSCGCRTFKGLQPYYTHQYIELPKIVMTVIHFILYKGECTACGKVGKGHLAKEFTTGFGPRLSGLVANIGGIDGNSRETIQAFCSAVLGIAISQGAIQKIIDRVSTAIKPHYEAIRDKARSETVNHLDETTWKNGGKLNWLWVMANSVVAYFMIHTNRSQAAFDELIGAWEGILVSDGYRIYQKWVNKRQSCLAHLIRRAKGLSERSSPELAKCGTWAKDELTRLCEMAKAPPSVAEWRAFYARLCRLIALYRDSDSEAGIFVRHIENEMDSLFTFLTEEGVDPTNNFAERMIRYAVLWRKRSQGTCSEKGNRWVERIVSLRQTSRLQGKSTFDILVDAMTCYFKDQQPDLEWIRTAA